MLTKALIPPYYFNNTIDIRQYCKTKHTYKIICPSCKSSVIAKKGRIKKWHFAHADKINCEFGYETELHLIAKSLIKPGDIIYLPPLVDSSQEVLKYFLDGYVIDDIIIEQSLSDIKPDLIIISQGHRLLVEIAVTHFVDTAKERKIKNLDISCIEIDLSDIRNDTEEYSEELIRKYILGHSNKKKWIYQKYENKIKQIKAEEKRIAKNKSKQETSNKIIRHLQEPQNTYIEHLELINKVTFRREHCIAQFEGVFRVFDNKEIFFLDFSFYNCLNDVQGAFLSASYDKIHWIDIDIMDYTFKSLRGRLFFIIRQNGK